MMPSQHPERIVAAIREWARQHSYAPSFRDLSEAVDLPLGTVHAWCRRLRADGTLTFDDNTARSIQLTGESHG